MNTLFIFNPADDSASDSEYVLLSNPNVTIQVSPYMRSYGGMYCVNRWIPEEEAIESYGSFQTLPAAKAKAVEVAKQNKVQ